MASCAATRPNEQQRYYLRVHEPILQSTITCPQCGHEKEEIMPTDACQWFYECQNCTAVLRPKPGDCCVYCSYGSVKCPPVQMQADGGSRCCG